MGKNLVIAILVIGVAVLVYLNYWPLKAATPAAAVPTKDEPVICAQVITSARDPKTGTIKEYPTPCDVPKGWEVIQNDVPSLDLQVQ